MESTDTADRLGEGRVGIQLDPRSEQSERELIKRSMASNIIIMPTISHRIRLLICR